MARINVKFADNDWEQQYRGQGSRYFVQVPPNKVYYFFIDFEWNLTLARSRNNGLTWDEPIRLAINNLSDIYQYSIWYDSWSDINSNLIHIIYVTNAYDYFYINYNVSTETISSPVTVVNYPYSTFNPISFTGLSITRAKGGNLGIYYSNDYIYSGFAKSSNTGSAWANVTSSQQGSPNAPERENIYLLPELSSDDPQDMVAFTLLNPAATYPYIFKKFYDNSLNTWFTSSFGSGSYNNVGQNIGIPWLAAFPDLVNSQSVLIGWNTSGYPFTALTAQLRCYTITSASTTTKTSVIASSGAGSYGQGPCGLTWNRDDNAWYAFYGGKSTGGEDVNTMNIYYKKSTDQGTTWSSETRFTSDLPTFLNTQSFGLVEMVVPPIISGSDNMVIFMGNSSLSPISPQGDINPLYINTFLPTAGGSIVVT